MNKVILRGFLTSDAQIQEYGENGKRARFNLGVKRKGKDAGSDFPGCIAFGKRAEVIAQYFKKGTQVEVEGHIQTGKYDKDGQTIYTTDIVVDDFEFVGGGGAKQSQGQQAQAQQAPQAAVGPEQNNSGGFMNIPENVDDSGMPFNFS